MNLLLPIVVVAVAGAAYRSLEKLMATTHQPPIVTAAIIGGVEMLAAALIWLALGHSTEGITSRSIWLSVAIGLSVVAIDAGLLYTFLRGGDLAKVTVWTGAGTVLLLVFIGMLFFREHLSPWQLLGIALGLTGMALLKVG